VSGTATARVLFVPGGGSSVDGYFGELRSLLEQHATVIEVDPPRLDPARGLRWLRLADHAALLAEAVPRDDAAPVVVVGHSLGGLVALRLALDHPDRIAALLLLDPSPLMPAALLPGPLLRVVGEIRQMLRRLTAAVAPTRQKRVRAPRAVPLLTRLLWYLVLDGVALAADTAFTKLHYIPVVLVSAGEHTPGSVTRRTHEHLAAWLPNARLEVWPDTTHPLHLQRPAKIAEAVVSLIPGGHDAPEVSC